VRQLSGKRKKGRRMTGLYVTVVLATLILTPGIGLGSSHREAPSISQDPAVDDTDVYAFVSPERADRVVLIGNWNPGEEPSSGPNYYRFADDARYRINVDTDGQLPVDDIVFEFAFRTEVLNPDATFLAATGPITSLEDPDYNLRQYFTVTKIVRGVRGPTMDRDVRGRRLLCPPNNIGPFSTPNYANLADEAVYELSDGVRVFAGQRDDPFYVDLGAAFDGLQLRPVTGTLFQDNPARLGQPGGGRDALAGFNVHTIAVEVPISQLVSNSQPVIGVYTSALRPTMRTLGEDGSASHSDTYVQVSRLGFPLVNELFNSIPERKDRYNRTSPGSAFDTDVLRPRLRNPELTVLFKVIFPQAFNDMNLPPQDRRDDLVAAVLTGVPNLNAVSGAAPADLLRLNTSLGAAKRPGDPGYSRLGVLGGDTTGFPNGRRLWDDVVDIELRVAAGVLYKALIEPSGPNYDVAPNNLLSDGVDTNDYPFLAQFPFVPHPTGGKDTPHAGPVQGVPAPTATNAPPATPTSTRVGVSPTATSTRVAVPPTATATAASTRAPVKEENGGCNVAAAGSSPRWLLLGLTVLVVPAAVARARKPEL
jgi:hypothetical protein